MKVQELIAQLTEDGLKTTEIAEVLGVSQPMISQYRKGYNSSIDVAIKIFKDKGLVLFPFSKEALEELSK
jgi:predicted transcriptional regulator